MLNTDVTVTATDIADGAVTTAKLADDAVTPTKVTDQIIGRKNLIINGAMQIAQRGTSVSISSSQITYTLDRFLGRPNASTDGSVGQVTDAPEGFQYSARVRRSSGQTGNLTRFEQPFETSNIIPLRGKKVTISFYAKAGSGFTPSALSVLLFEGNGTERNRSITSYDSETTLVNTPKTLTTSWQRFTHTTTATIASDTTQLALQFQAAWSGTAPSGDEYYITGIQLEAGDTATPFEHRSFTEELQLCRRYFISTNSDNLGDTANGSYYTTGTWYNSRGRFNFVHPVQMRTKPSGTVVDASGNGSVAVWSGATRIDYTGGWVFENSSVASSYYMDNSYSSSYNGQAIMAYMGNGASNYDHYLQLNAEM